MEPISIDAALAGSDAITQVSVTSDGVFWLATIASEDGRTTIRRLQDDNVVDLTPLASVRSRIMEYGGGAYDVAADAVVYCDDYTKLVMLIEDGEHRPLITARARYRYGGLHLDLDHRIVVAVREDHDAPGEARTEIVALELDSDNADGGRVLVTGADFYAGPRARGDELAWFQWDHPNMSWDTAAVWRGPLDGHGTPEPVLSRAEVSAMHPLWLPNGDLAFCSDQSGYWNWQVGDRTLTIEADCAVPVWVLDRPVAAVVDENRFASIIIEDGLGTLGVWQTATGELSRPLPGTATIESVAAHDGDIYVIADWSDRPATLERIDAAGERKTLVSGEPLAGAVAPESLYAQGPAGQIQSFFYPVPGQELPPLLVMTHGGPTGATTAGYDRTKQFWISRGVAVLDVNYSGSTGFGRAYRDRLKSAWGVLDVADVIAAVEHVTAAGLADPERVVITGGSAGGYTTLQALVTSDVFAAGMSRYGVADLRALTTDTHKAESRYLDGLIGPLPEAEAVYLERSPISRLDALRTPMLILQGTVDSVVPPNQAELMADAVRDKHLPVALVMFEGEGHGFRGLSARRGALEAQVSFLQQVLGLEHSHDVPTLHIENL